MAAYVIVAGPMGVGKSTTSRALARALEAELHLESDTAGNPFLERFYEPGGQRRWAFASQTFFVCEALRQQQQITASHRAAVQDRSVFEHLAIFAANLHADGSLDDAEHDQLHELAAVGLHGLRQPDVAVMLSAPQQVIEQRIAWRGRRAEQDIDRAYLTAHVAAYEPWRETFDICPVIDVDTTSFDPRRDDDVRALAARVRDLSGC